MTTPATFKNPLLICQGATFRAAWKYQSPSGAAINLTGCTARMQVRASITDPVPLVSLTTGNGGITLGGAAGTISLYISDAATASFAWRGGVWDFELVWPNGDVDRLAQGSVTVSPEVTR
jgi:hypothetical protein